VFVFNQAKFPLSEQQAVVPPHLRNNPWPTYQIDVLAKLFPELRKALNKLRRKITSKRVHAARVVLRRWQAVTKVVTSEVSPIRNYKGLKVRLNTVRKILGNLRDWEILLELGETLDIPESLQCKWRQKRVRLLAKVEKCVSGKSLSKRLRQFNKSLKQQQQNLARFKDVSHLGAISAYNHLEPLLDKLEDQARQAESTAFSPEQLHELRLKIKYWRYFLTEFYGLTNLELVKAQQLLGKIHDLDFLVEVISQSKKPSILDNRKLARIMDLRQSLLQEFAQLRRHLPYGLRPSMTSSLDRISELARAESHE
jgi:CHAD domain-containing protein